MCTEHYTRQKIAVLANSHLRLEGLEQQDHSILYRVLHIGNKKSQGSKTQLDILILTACHRDQTKLDIHK